MEQNGVLVMLQIETKRPLQKLVYTSSFQVLTGSKSTSNKFTGQPGNRLTGPSVNQQAS